MIRSNHASAGKTDQISFSIFHQLLDIIVGMDTFMDQDLHVTLAEGKLVLG